MYRYRRKPRPEEPVILARMTEIGHTRIRYGYRRIHVLMAREGWHINHKRFFRLYQLAGLRGADEATETPRECGTTCRTAARATSQ